MTVLVPTATSFELMGPNAAWVFPAAVSVLCSSGAGRLEAAVGSAKFYIIPPTTKRSPVLCPLLHACSSYCVCAPPTTRFLFVIASYPNPNCISHSHIQTRRYF